MVGKSLNSICLFTLPLLGLSTTVMATKIVNGSAKALTHAVNNYGLNIVDI
jgi:hypothetical protein